MPSNYNKIEKAINYLVQNSHLQPELKDLAKLLKMSEFHCHREFKKLVGITPKDFLQAITIVKGKKLLRRGKSLMEVSLSLGLSSTSRLHDLFVTIEAMTPGEFKKLGQGINIKWGVISTTLGKIAIAETPRGICHLSFCNGQNLEEVKRDISKKWGQASFSKMDQAKLQKLENQLSARIQGKEHSKLNLIVKGSAFQLKVWEALIRIPEGEIVTYQSIANLIGAPRASRAVGTAVGANPIGYLIPCHRVIKSTGAVGDYHWGSDKKLTLLAIENARSLND